MMDWLEEVAGTEFISAALWTLLALLILVVVLVIVRIVRGMNFGTFVAGGRNRKTRLAVMDATAVDTHRRLVLVRRDDVEHLILIGGPTDVVVEQNIRFGQQQRRPAPAQDLAYEQAQQPQRAPEPAPPPPQRQQSAPPRPQPPREPRIANAPARAERPAAPPPQRAPEPKPAPVRPAPVRVDPPRHEPSLSSTTRDTYLPRELQAERAPPNARAADLDKALVDELNVSLDQSMAPPARAAKQEVSLEDEMNKLLGELTGSRRQ